MGAKLNTVKRALIAETGDVLGQVAKVMTQLAADMEKDEMDEIHLSWNQRQWDAFDLMVTLGSTIGTQAPSQLVAHRQRRESMQQKTMKKSQVDRDRKKNKKSEGSQVT